jgi:transcription elongation factor GreA
MSDIWLSKEGQEKMFAELKELKTVKRREITEAISVARAHGDLKENAEYDAAKEAQAHNERRISELEEKLSRVKMIDDSAVPKDKVSIGKTVTILNIKTGKKLRYTLVAEEEADFENQKISVTSPIGKALIGAALEEEVEAVTPGGVIKFKILEMTM